MSNISGVPGGGDHSHSIKPVSSNHSTAKKVALVFFAALLVATMGAGIASEFTGKAWVIGLVAGSGGGLVLLGAAVYAVWQKCHSPSSVTLEERSPEPVESTSDEVNAEEAGIDKQAQNICSKFNIDTEIVFNPSQDVNADIETVKGTLLKDLKRNRQIYINDERISTKNPQSALEQIVRLIENSEISSQDQLFMYECLAQDASNLIQQHLFIDFQNENTAWLLQPKKGEGEATVRLNLEDRTCVINQQSKVSSFGNEGLVDLGPTVEWTATVHFDDPISLRVAAQNI